MNLHKSSHWERLLLLTALALSLTQGQEYTKLKIDDFLTEESVVEDSTKYYRLEVPKSMINSTT